MGFVKWKSEKSEKSGTEDKSIYVSDVKIDRNGESWKKKSYWFRQEHLGKLKAISHFKGKTSQELIVQALEEYVKKNWDNSVAMKKMVSKATESKS